LTESSRSASVGLVFAPTTARGADRQAVNQLTGDHVSDPLHRVGLVSDTHGLIRPEALDALRDSDLIIHCGDVGNPAVLDALQSLAPVRAIGGNNDKDAWAFSLPSCDVVEVGTHAIYVLHDLSELDLDPAAAGFTAVVSGHSHKPVIEERGKILFVNPGSAGPRANSALCSAVGSHFPNPASAGPSALSDPAVLSTAASSFAGSTHLRNRASTRILPPTARSPVSPVTQRWPHTREFRASARGML
jgi:uncharacterized protein